MLTITFTMFGDVQLARGIERYSNATKDFRPVWQQIRDNFLVIERQQFISQGSRSGSTWAPLSLNYLAWKNKYFPGKPILQLTGALIEQMTTDAGLQTEIEPLRLRMKPTTFYAPIHQQGAPSINLPPRKVVQLTEIDKRNWMKMIHNYIYDKAREAHLA